MASPGRLAFISLLHRAHRVQSSSSTNARERADSRPFRRAMGRWPCA